MRKIAKFMATVAVIVTIVAYSTLLTERITQVSYEYVLFLLLLSLFSIVIAVITKYLYYAKELKSQDKRRDEPGV